MIYYTHRGTNHEDEQVGCAISELAGRTLAFKRVSSFDEVEDDGVVADIFRIYNPEKEHYDHHQDFLTREDGYPYASAGLMWKHYGRNAIKNIIAEDLSDKWIEEIHKMVDENFIKGVDACDADPDYQLNASCSAGPVKVLSTAAMTILMNEDDTDSEQQEEMFETNVVNYKRLLKKLILNAHGFLKDKERFYQEIVIDNGVAIFENSIRWKKLVYEHNKAKENKIYFVIMPSLRPENKYVMFSVPIYPGSRKLIYPIERPDWFSGFIHNGKWIAGGDSLDNLFDLADYSYEQNKRKTLEIDRAKRLEDSMKYFTNIDSDFLKVIDKVDIVDEFDSVHVDSERFKQCVKDFHEARNKIYEFLNIEK